MEMKLRNGNDKPTSPLKAIKEFCLECCGYNSNEVKNCTAPMCALFDFRNGHNPYRKTKEYTEEEKAELAERMRVARENQNRNA